MQGREGVDPLLPKCQYQVPRAVRALLGFRFIVPDIDIYVNSKVFLNLLARAHVAHVFMLSA